MSLVLNYNPEDIVSEKVMGYYTQEYSDNKIRLVAFVELKVKHPEAPDHAMLPVIDTKVLVDGNKNELPELVVFNANQESIKNYLKTLE